MNPDLPFTVTWAIEDNGNTFSDTVTISGCNNPAIVPPAAVTGAAGTGGSVACADATVEVGAGSTTCTATPDAGYTFDEGSMTTSSGALSDCSGATCTLSGVTSDVTVSATFSEEPAPVPGGDTGDSGDDGGVIPPRGGSSSPTLGEFGLLLSGIALAGAAAPALRRRERREREQRKQD